VEFGVSILDSLTKINAGAWRNTKLEVIVDIDLIVVWWVERDVRDLRHRDCGCTRLFTKCSPDLIGRVIKESFRYWLVFK
jgi:hypothetical protein